MHGGINTRTTRPNQKIHNSSETNYGDNNQDRENQEHTHDDGNRRDENNKSTLNEPLNFVVTAQNFISHRAIINNKLTKTVSNVLNFNGQRLQLSQ